MDRKETYNYLTTSSVLVGSNHLISIILIVRILPFGPKVIFAYSRIFLGRPRGARWPNCSTSGGHRGSSTTSEMYVDVSNCVEADRARRKGDDRHVDQTTSGYSKTKKIVVIEIEVCSSYGIRGWDVDGG
jgi:hypothetical protein